MFVKICGITRLEDAEAAIAHGATAVGFVFWPGSPRAMTAGAVRAIVDALPPETVCVGVFVNQRAEDVNDAAEAAGLTHVQLHGDETPTYASAITRPVIKATSLESGHVPEGGWPPETIWLVDAHDPARRGGTGHRANWDAAAEFARTRRVLLAGGLTPENVAAAIADVNPFGIDVSSGVERQPGIKDAKRIAALMAAVNLSAQRKARTRNP
jgi:phosphoribosylanthranilate isomerase